MPTHKDTPISLHPVIAAYFAADPSDGDTVARCFTETAIVIDERLRPDAKLLENVPMIPFVCAQCRGSPRMQYSQAPHQ